MKPTLSRQILTAALAFQLGLPAPVAAAITDIASVPVGSSSTVKPNVVFVLDDSGSMDFEVLLGTNDGAFWWDGTARNGWEAGGAPKYNTAGAASGSWYKYSHLFPNGCAQETRRDCDAIPGNAHFAIPPTPQFASLRSSAYNPLYYNPRITYQPWAPAYISGATRTFGNAAPTAARSHPWFGGSTPVTINLTQTVSSQAGNWIFVMQPGMVIPGATIPGITAKQNNGGSFVAVATDYTIAAGEYWVVSIPYFPATYWMPDPTCTSGPDCTTAPDGVALRRYEIKSGNDVPGGRAYADELQNFANWFPIDRKRKLMLAGAAGLVLNQVRGLRGGIVQFNSLASVTMYDANNASDSHQSARAARHDLPESEQRRHAHARGAAVRRPAVSQQREPDPVRLPAQQRVRDDRRLRRGQQRDRRAEPTARRRGVRPRRTRPRRNHRSPTSRSPTTRSISSRRCTGQVPIDVLDTSPAADRNSNLHMTTYAMTLGTKGTIFNTPAQPASVYANPPTWPAPTVDRSPTAVDDLWHATINSRGLMFDATDPVTAASRIQATINDIIFRSAPESAVAVSNVNLRAGDNSAFVSSYNLASWYGELGAYPVDVVTGNVVQTTPIWTARDQLDARDPEHAAHRARTTAPRGSPSAGRACRGDADDADAERHRDRRSGAPRVGARRPLARRDEACASARTSSGTSSTPSRCT